MSATVVRDQDLATACSCGCDRTRHVDDVRPHAGACIDCPCQWYARLQPSLLADVAVCAGGTLVLWLIAVAAWTWS